MATVHRFTSRDLELLPDPIDGTRYEIIDGELHVSKQPHSEHQDVSGNVYFAIRSWDPDKQVGRMLFAPGVIFSQDNDVVPDLIWISNARAVDAYDSAGHLRMAPELMVEVLSLGAANERRGREAKRKLYARRGVDEYWIVDLQGRRVEVFRQVGGALEPRGTLLATDRLESPLLPGFGISVEALFLAATL